MCHPLISTQGTLSERLSQATIGTLELYSVFLGTELGLYRALHGTTRLTTAQLAKSAGIAPRYAREWLEQQAVAGFVCVDDVGKPADERSYWLPADHASVLVDEESSTYLAPLAQMLAGIGGALQDVVAAYRTGEGVPYARYGAAFRRGQSGINRPAFTSDLTRQWLPAVPGLYERLASATAARIADVGCGGGWSTIALAEAFPNAEVIGFDLDAASVEAARLNASEHGSRARFVHAAAESVASESFDLILLLETLHDLSQPVQVLQSLRDVLAKDGVLFVADERVAHDFIAPGDETERMMYGWSIVHCLPAGMAQQPSAAIGTAIRPATVARCAGEAGFGTCEILPLENDVFRFYALRE